MAHHTHFPASKVAPRIAGRVLVPKHWAFGQLVRETARANHCHAAATTSAYGQECADLNEAAAHHGASCDCHCQQHWREGPIALKDGAPTRTRAYGGTSTATLSRVFLQAPTNQALRVVLRRGPSLARGPLSVAIFFLTVAAAIVSFVVRHFRGVTKSCQSCRGYGIERCPLCGGSGTVSWEAKFQHTDPCPMCMGRRYTKCNACGGLVGRGIFQHGSTANVSVDPRYQPQPEGVLAGLMD